MNLTRTPALPAFEDLGSPTVGLGAHRAAGEDKSCRDCGDGEENCNDDHDGRRSERFVDVLDEFEVTLQHLAAFLIPLLDGSLSGLALPPTAQSIQ